MKKPKPIPKPTPTTGRAGMRRLCLAIAALWVCAVWTTQAQVITSVVETGGDTDAPAAKFTGETFDHPNLGAGYTAVPFGDEVPAFTDRVHEWTAPTDSLGMPPYLDGAEYIMLQNDNRDNAGLMLEITVSQPAFIYILFDNRYADGVNTTPPAFAGGTQWILDDGWLPMSTGHNRTGDTALPDEVGVDEGADGAGSGQGINQWSSIYVREVVAGTYTLLQADNAGRNMYGVVVTGADPTQFPPNVSDVVPSNGTSGYDPAGGISFSVTTDENNAVPAENISLSLNGQDVTGDLTITGTDTARAVTYAGLSANTIYRAEINATDGDGRVRTVSFSFDTFAEDAIVIEAENWNFDGGMFIENPVLSFDPGDPNSYVDKGVEFGVPGVDYNELNPEFRPSENEWRIPFFADEIGLPQTQVTIDVVRQQYIDAGIDDYDLTDTEPGEWMNYSRTFPAGDYHVAGRFTRISASYLIRLEIVTSDPTQENQTTDIVGFFLGEGTGTGWELVPLTDVNGSPVTVSLDGLSTLRLTVVEGNPEMNFFMLGAVDTAAALPSVVLTAPADGAAFAPGDDVELTADATAPGGAIVSVDFFAILEDGTETALGSATSAPYAFTFPSAPEGIYDVFARATNDSGLVAQSAMHRVYVDNTPPTIVAAKARPTGPDDIESQVSLTFSEVLDNASAVDPANYSIASDDGPLNITSVTLSANETRVTIITDRQTIGTTYTVTVTGVTDKAGNAVEDPTEFEFNALGPFVQTETGFVIFEAESYDRVTGEFWHEVTELKNEDTGEVVRDSTAFSGGIAMHTPEDVGDNENNDQVQFDVIFVKTGTHIVWYRAGAHDGSADSGWLHVDGARPIGRESGNTASMSGFNGAGFGGTELEWNSDPQDGPSPYTIEIETVGLHTIALGSREDAAFFDKFIITTNLDYDPTTQDQIDLFGLFGPPETPREGAPPPDARTLEITMQPVDATVDENQAATFTVDAVSDGLIAFQWQQREGDNFVDIENATGASYTIDPATVDLDGTVLRVVATVIGNEATSDEATLTVIPDETAPDVIRASGQAATSRVLVSFTEPLDPVSATDIANYSVEGSAGMLEVLSADYGGGLTVILNTADQTVGDKYTVTVNGVADVSAAANQVVDGQAKFYSLGFALVQNEQGLLVFEAENYVDNLDLIWEEDSSRGNPSGGLSMVAPNGAGGSEGGTQLIYDVDFTQTGTHIVWYRASGESGSDDSGWLWIDGARARPGAGNEASMTGFSGQADFVWRSQPQDGGGQYTIDIPAIGFYELALARREDGSFFDKFAISSDPNFDPNSFGPFGPPETREGAPPLPTLSITSPAEGATFDEGANVDITVEISETTRVISKVEFFANGNSIGEATESPYSFTLENAPAGAHLLTAVLTDDVADSVRSQQVLIIVGELNEVLMLVGNPDLTAAPGDQAIHDRLVAFGFDVVVIEDAVSVSTDALGRKLIVNSSTVGSGDVGTKFRDATVPVVSWEQANQDDFGMTGDGDGTDRGTAAGQTDVEILDVDHPLNAGLAAGQVAVVTEPTGFSFGLPNANAVRIATVVGNSDQVVVYGYETGAEMVNGFVAPARRVHLFLNDTSFTLLTNDGLALFDAALEWALDEDLPDPGGDNITITSVAAGPGGLTISWSGGTGPYTVQKKNTLNDAAWTDVVSGTAETSVTVPIEGASGFFQVIQ